MSSKKVRSNKKEGQQKIDSFFKNASKVSINDNKNTGTNIKVQLFQDGWIESLKSQSRKADIFGLKSKSKWSDGEYRKIIAFLQKYIPQWDLDGNGFITQWDDLNQETIATFMDLNRSSKEKELKNGVDYYQQVLYFFAVFLPQFSPDKDQYIIYRGLKIHQPEGDASPKIDELIDLMAQGKYYKDYTNLGTSWSWNPDSIRDITNVSPNVRLISKINKKEVDWERTILFNSSFTFGRKEFGGEGEDEVRILENIAIPILAIEKVEWDSTIHQYKTLKTVQIPSKYRFRTD